VSEREPLDLRLPSTFQMLTVGFSYQEDFYSFATLSLEPPELRLTVSKHLDIDWDPESVGHLFSRQAVFAGIYDG
jgi:protein phosphatase PTC6